MDGLFAWDLWDVVIEVLRSTNNTKMSTALALGDRRRTEFHSNKNMISHSMSLASGNRNEHSSRNVDQMSKVDHVPSNAHSSQGESMLYIYEENEAVIKMIIKGRSPTMRHVSRTHRVALDWLFDKTPKSKLNMLTPKTNSLTC